MATPLRLLESGSGAFGGHLFGDWTHGIDHHRCGHCGLYHHAFATKEEKKPCPVAAVFHLGPGGIREQSPEDFGETWAIRPELTSSDIYNDGELLDVRQFDSRDELFKWLDDGPHPDLTNRRRRWWGRVAVRPMAPFGSSSSEVCSFKRFRAWGVPLAPWPESNWRAALARTLADEDPPISCKLGSDWDFETIVQNTSFRPGHAFAGTALISFPDQLSRVIDDLQQAFRSRYPGASADAESSFLESWDVLRHTAEFCGKSLAPSPEARELVRRAGSRDDVDRAIEAARESVRLRIAVYCAAIRNGGPDLSEASVLSDSAPLKESRSAIGAEPNVGFRFPTPSGTRWEDIAIRFLDGTNVSVSIGTLNRKLTYVELGMKDGRDADPTEQWQLLEKISLTEGRISWNDSGAAPKVKKQRELLQQKLQQFFQIDEPAFTRYHQGIGWTARFKILPGR